MLFTSSMFPSGTGRTDAENSIFGIANCLIIIIFPNIVRFLIFHIFNIVCIFFLIWLVQLYIFFSALQWPMYIYMPRHLIGSSGHLKFKSVQFFAYLYLFLSIILHIIQHLEVFQQLDLQSDMLDDKRY